MAIKFMEGFEIGSNARGVASGLSVGAVRSGFSGSYSCNSYGVSGYYLVPSDDEYYGHIRWEPNALTYGSSILAFRNGSTYLVRIYSQATTGYAQAWVGGSSVETASTNPMLTGVVYSIQFYVKIADTGGRIVIKVNNVTVIDYTGDTKPSTETTIDNILMGYMGGSENGGYLDDIVLDDANYPGHNLRIEGIVPSGAGTTTQWDPSTGSNYACVDEKPPSDTDYNSTNVTNEIDTFAMGDLVADVQTILAVQVILRAAYEGAPTPTHIQPTVRVGSTDYPSGTDIGPDSTFSHNSYIWALNPADSAAWEEADVNGMEAGYKATA